MAYIGQGPFNEFSTIPTKDTFTGDGSTTVFDMAVEVPSGSENALEVFVDNIRQEPGSGKAFTLGLDGSSVNKRITFTAAPANGAAIYVINDKTNTTTIVNPIDLGGVELILDADNDTSITADTDDQIDFKIGSADHLKILSSSGDTVLKPMVDAKDIIFQQFDGNKVFEINDGNFVSVGGNAAAPGEIRIYEDTDLGTNYSGFKVGNLTGSVAYQLPLADGNSGQALATNGSGVLSWATVAANTPTSADGQALGSASLEWSDLFLADAAVINFGADQDINITHVADTGLTTNGTFQATTITATTAFVPDASDGAALGTTALEFSDLFLADGAVINFGDDQDINLTHVADTGLTTNGDFSVGDDLTVLGGQFDLKTNSGSVAKIKFYCESGNAHAQTLQAQPHSASASDVLTLPTGGDSTLVSRLSTDTLTNKTLTSPVINTGTFGTSILPTSADGTTLGSASKEFSDLFLADASTIQFGADQDVILTHVADTGILLSGTNVIQFNDASQNIGAPSNAILDINATDEIELNATLVDVNANLDVSGTITSGGVITGTAFTAGSAVLAEAELELLDGLTAGTAIASKVVTTDANIDSTGMRNLTISGEIDAATGDFSGAVDVAGATTTAAITASGLVTANANITMAGTTPTLTIGDAGAEDTKIVFDGNAVDFVVGLDDSADEFRIGVGSALGSTRVMEINSDGVTVFQKSVQFAGSTPTVTIGDAGAEDAKIVFDGNAQDYHIGLDDSADSLILGLGSALGTTEMITLSTSAVVFNEDSQDLDFRVESNDNANMLFVDAGNNRIGVGTASPARFIDAVSSANAPTMEIRSSVTPNGSKIGGGLLLSLNQANDSGSGANDTQVGDILGRIVFQGQGTDYTYNGAEISTIVTVGDGSDGRVPQATALTFATIAVGGDSSAERFRVSEAGIHIGGTGAANALDDYEEGTFTPIFVSDASAGAYNIQDGDYTKVGDLVHICINLSISTIGSFAGAAIQINGLPFASENVNSSGNVMSAFVNGAASAMTDPYFRIANNASHGRLEKSNGATSTDNSANANNIDTGTTVCITGTYKTV